METINDAISILTHAIKHQIAQQPVELSEVTHQQEWTIDILMAAKGLIRAERDFVLVRTERIY